MKEMIMSLDQINTACAKIGKELTNELATEEKLPLFVCVMKGAMEFMVDLMKHVEVPLLEDYVQIESYSGLNSTGEVLLKRDVSTDINDRTVVIVEDVVDTGLSMKFLLDHFHKLGHPKKIIVCALFDKVAMRKVEVKVDYVGMTLKENKFLLGYGLDYRGLQRNVPYVYTPTSEEVEALDEIILKRS